MKLSHTQAVNLAEKISKLTDENDHTAARVLLAKKIGVKHFIKTMNAILAIQNECGMPYEVYKFRDEITNQMLEHVKNECSFEIFELINSSL